MPTASLSDVLMKASNQANHRTSERTLLGQEIQSRGSPNRLERLMRSARQARIFPAEGDPPPGFDRETLDARSGGRVVGKRANGRDGWTVGGGWTIGAAGGGARPAAGVGAGGEGRRR